MIGTTTIATQTWWKGWTHFVPFSLGGKEARVSGVIGDDQDLGRPGQEIDADRSEELSLCLGDVGIPRPYDEVNRLDPLYAVGDRCERLHSPDMEDLVGTRTRHRVEHRRVYTVLAPAWRSGRDHALDARDLGRH